MSMTWHGEPPDAGGPEPLAPGATIGILGGGQLGRMSAMAAARLGYRCHVFAPDADSPGMQIAAATTVAAYEDGEALRRFSAAVDVVTFEFENVPAETLEALEPLAPCRPGVEVLRVCQDRLAEKEFLGRAGVPVAPWRAVRSLEELREAIAAIGLPAVLKTTRMGYDGRGQEVLRRPEEATAAYDRLEPKPLILEAFVPFHAEISAIVARAADGTLAAYDAVENRHREHILDATFAPARVPEPVALAARGPRGEGGDRARPGRRAGARDVPASRRRAVRKRDRPAPPQLGPLDHRRLPRQPVRAAHPRRRRPAPRRPRAPP